MRTLMIAAVAALTAATLGLTSSPAQADKDKIAVVTEANQVKTALQKKSNVQHIKLHITLDEDLQKFVKKALRDAARGEGTLKKVSLHDGATLANVDNGLIEVHANSSVNGVSGEADVTVYDDGTVENVNGGHVDVVGGEVYGVNAGSHTVNDGGMIYGISGGKLEVYDGGEVTLAEGTHVAVYYSNDIAFTIGYTMTTAPLQIAGFVDTNFKLVTHQGLRLI